MSRRWPRARPRHEDPDLGGGPRGCRGGHGRRLRRCRDRSQRHRQGEKHAGQEEQWPHARCIGRSRPPVEGVAGAPVQFWPPVSAFVDRSRYADCLSVRPGSPRGSASTFPRWTSVVGTGNCSVSGPRGRRVALPGLAVRRRPRPARRARLVAAARAEGWTSGSSTTCSRFVGASGASETLVDLLRRGEDDASSPRFAAADGRPRAAQLPALDRARRAGGTVGGPRLPRGSLGGDRPRGAERGPPPSGAPARHRRRPRAGRPSCTAAP